jgi:hypothetical protein
MNPLVISAFVEAVQRGLEARSVAPAAEVLRMPSAQELFYAAGASTGERKHAAR